MNAIKLQKSALWYGEWKSFTFTENPCMGKCAWNMVLVDESAWTDIYLDFNNVHDQQKIVDIYWVLWYAAPVRESTSLSDPGQHVYKGTITIHSSSPQSCWALVCNLLVCIQGLFWVAGRPTSLLLNLSHLWEWLRWTTVFLKKPEVYFRCLSLVLWDRPSLHQRMSFEPNRSIPLVMFRGPLLPNCGFNYPCFSESVEVPRMEPLEILRPTCNCSDIINHCSYFWVRDNTSPKNTSGVWL